MTTWYAPNTLKEYRQRLVTFRSLLLLVAVAMLIGTEFRFHWLEDAIGGYLVSTNKSRPESGAIWEQGRQSESARRALDQVMSQRQDVQREVRRATSMGQLLSGMGTQAGAMISASHFVELYLKLPPVISHEIVSPFTLLSHLSTNRWQRTFFELQDSQLAVYLLDDQNQVLHRLLIGPGLMEHIEQGEVAIHTSLSQLSDFAGRIYPAEQFFRILNTMPEQTRNAILASPEELLQVSGRIGRVGISVESMGDATALGFEVEDMQGTKVILLQGRTDAILRLQWMLRANSGGGSFGYPQVRP